MAEEQQNAAERVRNVQVDDDDPVVDLADGRTVSVPLAWFPRLLHASAEARGHPQISGGGFGIHWPAVDEDASTAGLLRGAPVRRSL